MLMPGFVKIDFAYYLDNELIDFCLGALEYLADNAIHLAPLYKTVIEDN